LGPCNVNTRQYRVRKCVHEGKPKATNRSCVNPITVQCKVGKCYSLPVCFYDFPAFFCNSLKYCSSDNNFTCAGFTVNCQKMLIPITFKTEYCKYDLTKEQRKLGTMSSGVFVQNVAHGTASLCALFNISNFKYRHSLLWKSRSTFAYL